MADKEVIEQKRENRYEYFNRYRTEATIQQNHQEIKQAIDEVKDVDVKIQKIWNRFIK